MMTEPRELVYRMQKPTTALADVVDSFWMLANPTDEDRAVTVLPDGRFDLFFAQSASEPFHVTFAGLGTGPSSSILAAGTVLCAVSFKPLAIEYVLHTPAVAGLNQVSLLPVDDWIITADNLLDFDRFCAQLSDSIASRLTSTMDVRKQQLFALIESSQGGMAVQKLADTVGWSRRQMHRYFTHWLGLSPKAYLTILRYRASFGQIAAGKLFPEGDFADQAHFIKDVKKYSGVTPKELARNRDGRFIQFSLLTEP